MQLTQKRSMERKGLLIVQTILIFTGFSELLRSDAYFSPYLIVSIVAFSCLFLNWNDQTTLTSPEKWLIRIFCLLFASMITLANYPIWTIGGVRKVIIFSIIFGGTFLGFLQIFKWININLDKLLWRDDTHNWSPLFVFFVVFIIIIGLNVSILFLCKYPGNLTADSINQIRQILTNSYSNHHPYWHTMTIKICISIGMKLFDDINAAVALYSVVSIIFVGASFSFTVATLTRAEAPKWLIICTATFFALMPYHIMNSMTMWKDVPFGLFILLFLVFFFRISQKLPFIVFNWIGFATSALGICLFRSNGLFAFVFITFFFFLFWRLNNKGLLFCMIAIILASFILKYPILSALGVRQTDLVESLSIPAQQVARVVVENKELTSNQRELLEKIVDVEKIPETYKPWISDPVKRLMRTTGDQDYLRDNSKQYIRLYFQLLFKYPGSFIRGWVDQTKGYWNSGYDYWRWGNHVAKNEFDINRAVQSEVLNDHFDHYLSLFTERPTLQLFISIGFFNWLVLGALFISIIRKDKVGAMMSIPIIMIVLSLLVATPVYSEFRYMYAVFCALPFILAVVLRPESMVENKEVSNG